MDVRRVTSVVLHSSSFRLHGTWKIEMKKTTLSSDILIETKQVLLNDGLGSEEQGEAYGRKPYRDKIINNG
jgi:hypothetical protein